MRVQALILGVALLLGLAFTACGQQAPTPTPAPTATPTRVPATPTATPIPPTPTHTATRVAPASTVAATPTATIEPPTPTPVVIQRVVIQRVIVHLTGIGTAPQSGEAVLTAAGDKTEVVINVKPGAAGVAQPVHIHDTECQLPPKVTYPLSNVVDGKSTTVVNATLAILQSKPFAICVHKSASEVTTYVAVGVIPFTGAVAPTPTPTSVPATPTATPVPPAPTATPTATAVATPTPTAFQVSIKNITLLDITIAVGTTLTWVNGDAVPHILGSGKDGKFDTAGWKSTTLSAGQSFSQTFSSTGTFSYTCQIHPTMNATVTVAQPGTPSSSTPASSGDTSGGDGGYSY